MCRQPCCRFAAESMPYIIRNIVILCERCILILNICLFAHKKRVMASPYSLFRICLRVGNSDARYYAERAFPQGQRGSSANRKRYCCLLILRKRLCDRVLRKKRKNSVFVSGWLSARFDSGISALWLYNYASVVRVLYKYAICVGVMGWRDGYMMRICVLYRWHTCFISLPAKSRDAKSCTGVPRKN